MDVPPPHIHMNQISTVTNEGKVRFMTYKVTMNDELFLMFLGRLLNSTTKKILLITGHHKTGANLWVARMHNKQAAKLQFRSF